MKQKHNNQLKYFNFPLFIFILFIALLVYLKLQINPSVISPIPPETYHGPNYSESLLRLEQNNKVLGTRSRYKRPSPTPYRIKSSPTIRPSATPSPILTITPVVSPIPVTTNRWGIAAGGRLIYLSQTDLNSYFDKLQSLGVKWIRHDVSWYVIQYSGASQFDWVGTDRLISTANHYGIKILGTIAYTPKWASVTNCTSNFACEPADTATFGRFVNSVATRYKDSIYYWEIWNEPNLSFFWNPKMNVPKYKEILQIAYEEIKKINSNATVISGGLAITGEDSTSPITFIKSLYEAGGQPYFDAIAIHPYTFPATPDYTASWNGWQQISYIRDYMVSYGDANKKIWITEYGAPTGGPGDSRDINYFSFAYGSDYMSENAQRIMAEQAQTSYLKNSGFLGPFFWYSLVDNGTSTNTQENFFGLLRYDGSKKPAYDTYRNFLLNNP